jgi:spoIIIJ-associated protein
MAQLIQDTLASLLQHLGLPFTNITVDESDTAMVRVNIDSPEASRLIGWHGETINAIQHLLKAILRTKERLDPAATPDHSSSSQASSFIVLDVDGYRRAQEEKVCRMALQKVDFVRRKRTRVALPPMSPYFRRTVHLFVARHPELQDLTTESVGEGEYRQVVLRLKEGKMDEGGELSPVITEEREGDPFEDLDI